MLQAIGVFIPKGPSIQKYMQALTKLHKQSSVYTEDVYYMKADPRLSTIDIIGNELVRELEPDEGLILLTINPQGESPLESFGQVDDAMIKAAILSYIQFRDQKPIQFTENDEYWKDQYHALIESVNISYQR